MGRRENSYGRRSRQNNIISYSQVQPILIAKVIKLFFYEIFYLKWLLSFNASTINFETSGSNSKEQVALYYSGGRFVITL